ncbi:hypothetical protein Hanom_Chr04g00302441 [Helianthus anomalus]
MCFKNFNDDFLFIIVSYFYYVMNLTRSELSNRPKLFYVQSYEIGVSKKVNPVKKIPGSATDHVWLK